MLSNPFIKRIISFIQKHELLPSGSLIIVGFSGGPDSVFLLHLLKNLQKQYNLRLIAAHLNHEWRIESEQEALFCKQVCTHFDIPIIIKKISELTEYTPKYNGSKEEYARRMRRYFFKQIKNEYNADLVALAHHANDQQETFFIRLLRGTTPTGLASIYPKNKWYIRPLLETKKSDILDYLHNNAISYCTDQSNADVTFLRNRIRHELLPVLTKCDKRFELNFQKTIKHLQTTDQFLARLTETLFNQIAHEKNGLIILSRTLLFKQDPFMRYRLILFWLIKANVSFTPTERFLAEIEHFLVQPLTHPLTQFQNKSQNKSHQIMPTWSIVKKSDTAFILNQSS